MGLESILFLCQTSRVAKSTLIDSVMYGDDSMRTVLNDDYMIERVAICI